VIAPGRARRPGVGVPQIEAPTEAELETCPFCEGREERTPPETLALPEREPADSPGWTVRVVPNLYPAFERQEVVIHSPRHVRSFAELEDAEVELVAEAWRLRAHAAREDGFGYVHALINEGKLAGASLAHSHSQLVSMRDVPPAVATESSDGIATIYADVHRSTDSRRFEITHRRDVNAICPPASRVPYEVLISSESIRDEYGFDSDELPTILVLLRDVVRRLRAVEGAVHWNAWLHAAADLHVELVPRLTVFAGIELGAGIYVNTLAPEDAARALRDAAV
jgi:UDPglucose--hexose-1-phosphate uridylyltransferase